MKGGSRIKEEASSMAKKGGSRHLKRLPAPKHWPIHVKEHVWAVKPRPGPHAAASSIPLAVAVRDILRYAKSQKEAKIILSEGKIRVDGVPRRDGKYPMGVMDVVEVPDAHSVYRVLPVPKRGLSLLPAPPEEKALKLCRIEKKTTVKDGRPQLNLHDGRNITIDVKDARRPAEDTYRTLDTLLVSVPENKVVGHFRFAPGAPVIVVKGRNMGRQGKVKEIVPGTPSRPILVTVEDPQGGVFQTRGDYVFVVGGEGPAIKLGAS
ncbi:MAG: 30S ribosomal protein S4e [Candidatus Bathyarchaeia archaeon]